MTNETIEEDEWWEPRRDERGRFRKGRSGNPHGRPRNRPEPPWALEESFARALAEEVSVTGPDGLTQKMAVRDLLIATAVRDALRAKPKDKIFIIERLAKLNLLNPVAEEDEGGEIFTEEDRRLIEIVQREVLPYICSQCDKPVLGERSEGRPPGSDFESG